MARKRLDLVRLPPCIASFPSLAEPTAMKEGEEKKYKVRCVWDASDTAAINAINEQSLLAAKAEWGDDTTYSDFVSPLVYGAKFNEKRRKKKAEPVDYLADKVFLDVRSKYPPGVFGRRRGPDGKPVAIPAAEIAGGDKISVLARFGAREISGANKAFAQLQGVQLIEKRPGSGASVAAFFEADLDDEAGPTENYPQPIGADDEIPF